jgi:eukaryotic-like serine/threonine-protein kinase
MNAPSSDETLFAEALARPAAERAAYLDQACASDPARRARLESLLRAEESAQRFLESSPAAAAARTALASSRPEEMPGDKIGRYKLLQKIGEGGCGVVYVAEQEEPVRRRVALKVIKLGMDTREVIARFEAERQALAMMDHPNIAKVLDAGATDTGRPFFVMELVRGVPLTRYCDEHNSSTAERLELFIAVCHAIQHAHQKGIIHRDIKPSNILVALHDTVAVPKVIDFGIAKATAGRLTDSTVYTAFEQFIGTPAYMSPEQALLSAVDIDTRSDIYSLGVLLYELLTGRTPFDVKSLVEAGLDEIRRIIREVEPPKPSTRLSTMHGDALTATAQRRQIAPPKLINLIRGDLDWIVMRCLEKDRARRYETANGLADDLRRHLSNEPVAASPPSAAYRFQKLVRRHRLAFAAGAAVTASLVIGLTVSTRLFFREKVSRQRAVAAEQQQFVLRRQAESARERAVAAEAEQSRQRQLAEASRNEEARQRALAETASKSETSLRVQAEAARNEEARQRALAETARNSEASLRIQAQADAVRSAQVARFLKDMLSGVGPSIALGRDATLLREILDKTVERIGKDLKDQPAVEAELRSTIGEVYLALGDFKKAEAMFREALRLRQAVWGAEHPDVASSLRLLAVALAEQVDPACEPLFRAALAMRRKLLGNEHLDVAQSLDNMALLLSVRREFDQAEAMEREALAIRRKLLGAEHPDVAKSLDNLANILSERGQPQSAIEPLRDEALTMRRKLLSEDHPDVVSSLANQAASMFDRGDAAGAEKNIRETLVRLRRLYGNEHPDIADALTNLGAVLDQQDDLAGAESALREALAMRSKLLGPDHQGNAWTLCHLGSVLEHRGDLAGAEGAYRRALALQRKLPGFDPKLTANISESLGSLLDTRGDAVGAEPMLREALALLRKLPDSERGSLANTLSELGVVLSKGANLTEAEQCFREELALRRKSADSAPGAVATTLFNIGVVLFKRDELAGAESAHREALALRRNFPDQEEIAVSLSCLGSTLFKRGHLDEAESLFREAVAGFRKTHGDRHPLVAGELMNLGNLARTRGDNAAAESAFREALAIYRQTEGNDHGDTASALLGVGDTLFNRDEFAAAEPFYRESLAIQRKLPPAAQDRLAETLLSLGTVALGARNDYTGAEALFREAWDIASRSASGDMNIKRGLLEVLVVINEHLAKTDPDKAAALSEWKAKLDEFKRAHPSEKPAASLPATSK